MKTPVCEKVAVRHVNTPSSEGVATARRVAIQAIRRQMMAGPAPSIKKEQLS
jgi:hypothetical protein